MLLTVIFRREMALYSQTEAESGESQNNSVAFWRISAVLAVGRCKKGLKRGRIRRGESATLLCLAVLSIPDGGRYHPSPDAVFSQKKESHAGHYPVQSRTSRVLQTRKIGTEFSQLSLLFVKNIVMRCMKSHPA